MMAACLAAIHVRASICFLPTRGSALRCCRSFASSASTSSFPAGFVAAGVRCGIKKKADALDFAMIASSAPCSAAAMFTTNRFQAAPVVTCRELLSRHAAAIHGVVVNSGCANACTGEKGLHDAQRMMAMAAEAGVANCLVMSTGVIGPFLDMQRIEDGLRLSSQSLSSAAAGWESASRAIMTTDTVPKLLAETFELAPGKKFSIAGMCKGAGVSGQKPHSSHHIPHGTLTATANCQTDSSFAGRLCCTQMIHPNLATMLGIVTTDAAISPECLQAATRYAVDRSFNAISVDGDTSTNDTVVVLANGQSPHLQPSDAITSTASAAYAVFQRCLTSFCIGLAQKLVRDGEGATKFVTIEVTNAASFAEARQVCSSIATSALVKTAMYGQDANWGRIVCAVGYSGVELDPNRVSLWFVDDSNDTDSGNLHLLRDGQPYQTDEERATELVRRPEIHIRIDLGKGKEAATMWTCDFSRQRHTDTQNRMPAADWLIKVCALTGASLSRCIAVLCCVQSTTSRSTPTTAPKTTLHVLSASDALSGRLSLGQRTTVLQYIETAVRLTSLCSSRA